MNLIEYPSKTELKKILERPQFDGFALEGVVKDIMEDVHINGDAAIKKYTLLFDKAEVDTLAVSEIEFVEAEKLCPAPLKEAIQLAKRNIEKFHHSQKENFLVVETSPGVSCWRKSVGIEKVGLYIPGGSAPLFSTVLMLGVPAKLAGCKEIILCTPPNAEGKIDCAILYTAALVGIKKVYKAGGVQAIAGMAYGTASIPSVYKIFGPGNQYVTCAKKLVNKEGVAIDMPAGPSELAILADQSCVPAFVAADLLSQAEHGVDSQVILVSDDIDVIKAVLLEVQKQLEALPRRKIAVAALENSKAILVKDKNEGIDLLNEYAHEHLIISCCDEE